MSEPDDAAKAAAADGTVLDGGCHCGALAVRFVTRKRPADLPLLACQCSFCRRHGTRATADPDGRMVLTVRDPAALSRYEFGLRTAQYLICRTCGTYIGAVCSDMGGGGGGGERGLLNVNCLSEAARAAFDGREPAPVRYDEEPREARLARRRTGWTPVGWEFGSGERAEQNRRALSPS
jgi:hypothetical protein